VDYRARRAIGSEGALPVVVVGAECSLASGQCTERAGDETDRFGSVEARDNGEFQRPRSETVAAVALQLGEAQGDVGFLGLQREARIPVGDDAAERIAERTFGRGGKPGEEVFDVAAVLRLTLRPEPWVGDRRGQHLQLQFEIALGGGAGQYEAAQPAGDAVAHAAPSEDRLQLVESVFPETADMQ